MDTDAVLARHPEVVLVDELAHTNAPGSAHEKRWQDVDQLLDAGIDVITTVNIQHLESLNDVVAAITGIKQTETVPDEVVRAAEQIELVDMTPQALRRRMAHGHIYPAERIDTALGNYFREGNLTALRELALLWVADRVEEGLDRYRAEHGIKGTWAARDRIVVALTGGPEGAMLLRRGARIAGRVAGRSLVGGARRPVRRHGRRPRRPRSNGNDCWPRTSAAACNSSSATTSPRPCWSSPGRSTAPRSSSARPGTAGSRSWSGPAWPTRSSRVPANRRVHGHPPTRRAGARTAAALGGPGRAGSWSWVAAVLLPVVLAALLLPWRGSLGAEHRAADLPARCAGQRADRRCPAGGGGRVIAGLLANYLYTPPFGSFTITHPENAFALVVFVVVGALKENSVPLEQVSSRSFGRRPVFYAWGNRAFIAPIFSRRS